MWFFCLVLYEKFFGPKLTVEDVLIRKMCLLVGIIIFGDIIAQFELINYCNVLFNLFVAACMLHQLCDGLCYFSLYFLSFFHCFLCVSVVSGLMLLTE